MRKSKLTSLAVAIGSLFVLGGCASIEKHDIVHANVKQEILATVEEPKAVIEPIREQVFTTVAEAPKIALKNEARFNLVVNNAPVGSILNSLVDGTSYSLVTPENLTGNISLNLKKVTAFEVLETLKSVYHYDYEVQGKTIIVYPNGIRTKMFVMNHLIGKRVGRSELKVSSGSLTDSQINTGNNSNGTTTTSNNTSGNQQNQIN